MSPDPADKTVEEMKDELRERDLPVSGTKAELTERLDEPKSKATADKPKSKTATSGSGTKVVSGPITTATPAAAEGDPLAADRPSDDAMRAAGVDPDNPDTFDEDDTFEALWDDAKDVYITPRDVYEAIEVTEPLELYASHGRVQAAPGQFLARPKGGAPDDFDVYDEDELTHVPKEKSK